MKCSSIYYVVYTHGKSFIVTVKNRKLIETQWLVE